MILASLLFPVTFAWATTFGPITVFTQAQNTGYFVYGQVTEGPTTYLEKNFHKPFTRWTLAITRQTQGEPLGSQVLIREPGGEIGDYGYHVAASAEFTVGEEVFVALHDTDEPDIKEVTGLASGKYSVETGAGGKQVVVSGLGLPVTGENGPLGPEEFTNLLERIARGDATAADKDIWVSKTSSHAHDEKPELEALARKIYGAPERHPADSAPIAESSTESGKIQAPSNTLNSQANSAQERTPTADMGSTGFSSWAWILALAVMAGLIIGFIRMLLRK
jgi:hypothetical protein